MENRLTQQIGFILEIDRLKTVLRRTLLTDRSRLENSAEHSWHLAMMAVVLQEHANVPVDLSQVLKMLLVHDLVEIDAGDTFIYDAEHNASKAARERQAAERIFNLLPPDQAAEIRSLWDEFEAQVTPESTFAMALDRLQPILHNYQTQGQTWRQHGISSGQVRARNGKIARGAAALWDFASDLIDDAVRKGYLADAGR